MEKVSLRVADYQTHHDLVIKSTQVYPPRLDIINAHNPLVEQSAGDRGRRPIVQLLDLLNTANARVCTDLNVDWGRHTA